MSRRSRHFLSLVPRLLPTLAMAGLLALAQPSSAAIRPEVLIVRQKQRIQGLTFSNERYPIVVRETEKGEFWVQIRLSGRFSGEKTRLLYENDVLTREADGRFTIDVNIRDATTELEFSTVNIFGKVQSETITLQSSPPDPVRELLKSVQSARSTFGFGINSSWMSYSDNSGETLDQIGIGAKASYSHFLGARRNHVLATNFYGTFVPLFKSRDDLYLQVIGANLRYGYYLGDFRQWKLWLYGGYFYTTTLSPNGRIGFQNLLGPQLYPTASLPLSRRRSIATYFKLAPLYGLDLSNREIAVGISYSSRPLIGYTSSWSVDYSQIRLSSGDAEIDLTSTVVGYSIGF